MFIYSNVMANKICNNFVFYTVKIPHPYHISDPGWKNPSLP